MASELHKIFPPRSSAGPSRSGQRSNVSLLTEGAGYYKRSKKVKKDELEKIVFDDDKRKDFLTGFRKRKQARIEERRSKAKKRDHEEHLAERREARRDLKARALENVRAVRVAMGLPADPDGADEDDAEEYVPLRKSGNAVTRQGEGDDQDDDDDDDDEEEEGEEEEYEDDDQMAVVTIQDDFEDELMGIKKKVKKPEILFEEDGITPIKTPKPDLRNSKPKIPLLPPSSRKQTKKRAAALKNPGSTITDGFPSEPTKTNIKQISSDYRSFETKSERKKMRELEKARRKEKWDIAKERRGGSSGRGRGGGSAGAGRGRGGAARGGASTRGKGGKKSKKAQWGVI